MTVLLGLDLSTRAAAAVSAPASWDGDWRQLEHLVVGESLRTAPTEAERIGRCSRIATRLAAFAQHHEVTQAWIESYAYGQATAAHTLGELGGLVRWFLIGDGVGVSVANMSSARKLMCGTIKRGSKPKEVVKATLQRAGAPSWLTSDLDLCDAMVALNYGLSEAGGYCFAQAA